MAKKPVPKPSPKPSPKPAPKPTPRPAPRPVPRPAPVPPPRPSAPSPSRPGSRPGPSVSAPKPKPPPPPPPKEEKRVPGAIQNLGAVQSAPAITPQTVTTPTTQQTPMEQAVRNIASGLRDIGILSKPVMAYALATAWHEADNFTALKERGSDDYFFRMYDSQGARPDVARTLGNTQPGDGVRYPGRGYVHITGRANYRDIGNQIGVDLENNPEIAELPEIAGKVLGAFFKSKGTADRVNMGDFVGARRTINPDNLGPMIAQKAMGYLDILRDADLGRLAGNVMETLGPKFEQQDQTVPSGALKELAATPAPKALLMGAENYTSPFGSQFEPQQAPKKDTEIIYPKRREIPPASLILKQKTPLEDIPTMYHPAPEQIVQNAQQSITPTAIAPSAIAGQPVSQTGALGAPTSLTTNSMLASNMAYNNYLNNLFNKQKLPTANIAEYKVTTPKIAALKT